jgi:hypothetical protein
MLFQQTLSIISVLIHIDLPLELRIVAQDRVAALFADVPARPLDHRLARSGSFDSSAEY